MKRIELLDTTLRDGAQAEGISFSVRDKLAIVETLDDLGIPLIEAGNPGSNPKDIAFFEAVRGLRLKQAQVAAFGATCRPKLAPADDPQVQSLLCAGTATVVIFGKSWRLHVTEVLRTTLEENVRMIRDTVAFFTGQGKRVIYDAEHFFDGWKADASYALRTVAAAAEAGASAICLCETNGGCFPEEVAQATGEVLAKVGGRSAVGVHAHNDGGLGVANSLAAVRAGATHLQGTLAGFGERCGNANLATILANLQLKMGYECIPEERLPTLTAAVRRVAEIANIVLADDMPYVGRKAFAHKAGMHMDGVRKCAHSFEHVAPERVGNERRFLMSEVAGRSAVLERIRALAPAMDKSDPAVDAVVKRLKHLENEGYQFEGADGSFELLIRKTLGTYRPLFALERFRIIGEHPASETTGAAAMIKVSVDGADEVTAAEGNGPVDALNHCLRKALERFYPGLSGVHLTDYKVRVLDGNAGSAAKVRVLMETTDGRMVWSTTGVSTDIIEASWIALVDSLEFKLIHDREQAAEASGRHDKIEQ
ncbi:MAG: citramalate synthase [Kiritimatiellae bacterium]|nr:citramalate synthase [Kiritimatiellia bacterium]